MGLYSLSYFIYERICSFSRDIFLDGVKFTCHSFLLLDPDDAPPLLSSGTECSCGKVWVQPSLSFLT